jgi:hypothetical protein
VFIKFPTSHGRRSSPTVALGGDHPEQLPASNEQGFEPLLCLIW